MASVTAAQNARGHEPDWKVEGKARGSPPGSRRRRSKGAAPSVRQQDQVKCEGRRRSLPTLEMLSSGFQWDKILDGDTNLQVLVSRW